MISHWLGWITMVVGISELLVYFARKSSFFKLGHLRGKHHIAWGKIMLAFGLLHIIAVGRSEFFSFNMGTISWLCIAMLLATYQLRNKIGKKWLGVHGIFAIALVVSVASHIFAVT